MYRNNDTCLFSGGDLATALNTKRATISELVDKMPREQFLNTSIDTLCEYIVQQTEIHPLVLHENQTTMQHEEKKIDVTHAFGYGGFQGSPVTTDGYLFKFYIPFSGDADLWLIRPSTYSTNPPRADINKHRNLLTLSFENTAQTEDTWFKKQLENALISIRQSISTQSNQISEYNKSLSNMAQKAIAHRREQLSKLHGILASFDIPLTKKQGMPEYKPIDIIPRKSIELPKVPTAGFKPEPAIQAELYEEILSNIRHMGATFEGTPQTYQSLGEDGLRDILLASLNSNYQGRATGEAFRKYGKTDIRIEEETRAAFVAECKLWAGEKVLNKALEQLLDYLTWRDCKAALIIFNKKVARFTEIQKTIDLTPRAHANFIREKSIQASGEWRYIFRSREDIDREITVHVFCFNLYVAPERIKNR